MSESTKPLSTVQDAPPQKVGGGAQPDGRRLAPRSARAALEPERLPQPLHSKRARHPIVIIGSAIFTIFLVLSIASGIAIMIGKNRFDAQGPLDRDHVVNIPRGLGLRDIAELLQREGVIDQPWVFVGGVLATKSRDELKSGEYQFTRQASMRDVVDTIVEGKVVQHQVTIPEGLTTEQIIARLMETDILTGTVKEVPREGTLLPETYRFTRGTNREQVIQRMQQAQRRLLQEIWDRRAPDLPIKSPEQLVTLASIIEKETGKADERTRVAAVFVNRLRQRMKLQSDPTIIYGLVGGKGMLGRPIMRSEIEQPTPYNTYVIEGLPPGPIANPGRASLDAAANPSRTKELFFVSDGTGGHTFSESLDAHSRAVQKLRALEQSAREAAKAGDIKAGDAQAVPNGPTLGVSPAPTGGTSNRANPAPPRPSRPAAANAEPQGQPRQR